MPLQTLTCPQAMAHGALVSGVKVVASYPGSPSSETVAALIDLMGPARSREGEPPGEPGRIQARTEPRPPGITQGHPAESHGLHVEWSSNEKVAMEIGIGASIAGRRALVATKSVGMNVMIDPLMALNLTPVHGGLVILLGDDPGGYGSQNDQDTRPLAPMLEMPWLEPATPAEGFAMIRAAFEVSEQLHTAVVVRITRSFVQQVEAVDIPEGPYLQPDLGLVREPWRFVPVPRNVVAKHRALHERLALMERWVDDAPFNRIEGEGDLGIIAAGFAHRKLLDVLGDEPRADVRVLKLGVLFPLPRGVVARFLAGCREVLLLEENEPYLEIQIKALAHDLGLPVRILGKADRPHPTRGRAVPLADPAGARAVPAGIRPGPAYLEADEASERPPRENYCAGCRFGAIIDALKAAAARLGQDPVLVGTRAAWRRWGNSSTPSSPWARRSAWPMAWSARGSASGPSPSSAIPRSST